MCLVLKKQHVRLVFYKCIVMLQAHDAERPERRSSCPNRQPSSRADAKPGSLHQPQFPSRVHTVDGLGLVAARLAAATRLLELAALAAHVRLDVAVRHTVSAQRGLQLSNDNLIRQRSAVWRNGVAACFKVVQSAHLRCAGATGADDDVRQACK